MSLAPPVGFGLRDYYGFRDYPLLPFFLQETLLYDLLSVRENFAFADSLYSLDSKKFKEMVEFSSKFQDIGEFLDI